MATKKVVDADQLDSDLTQVADAIRTKGETSSPLTFPDGFVAAVESIQTGEVVPEVEQATPVISFSSVDGLITATATQQAGRVEAGTKTATQQVTTKGSQTYTPTTKDQYIYASRYLVGTQIIKGDENLVPENIVSGVSIFGVEGAAETSGGVEAPDSLLLDPDMVYATTRPKDWLPMPTPGDDEIYVLCHVTDGFPVNFYAHLTTTGACTVDFGTITDGEFVTQETVSLTGTGAVNKEINPDNYGNLTADGQKQCMVRIKGPVTIFNGANATGPHPGVEVVCGIALKQIQFSYRYTLRFTWYNLRYVSFVGNGGASNLEQAFYYCARLVCIRCEKNNTANNLKYTFAECRNLKAVSASLISGTDGAVLGDNLLQGCALIAIPEFQMQLSTCTDMCNGSSSACIDFENIDTSACTSFSAMFRYGYAIRQIKNMNISSLTTTDHMFQNCQGLNRLTFAGETTPGGVTIELAYCYSLRHAALVETINSLPTATEAAILDISDCAGASELTDEEIAIATAKNWTITI